MGRRGDEARRRESGPQRRIWADDLAIHASVPIVGIKLLRRMLLYVVLLKRAATAQDLQ